MQTDGSELSPDSGFLQLRPADSGGLVVDRRVLVGVFGKTLKLITMERNESSLLARTSPAVAHKHGQVAGSGAKSFLKVNPLLRQQIDSD